MKVVISYLLLGIVGFHCTRTETVTVLRLPCDCKDYPLVYEYKNQKGTLIFPRTPTESYSIIAPQFAIGEASYFFAICSDSLSFSMIKQGKFTDSSAVLFDGGGLNLGVNGSVDCYNRPAIRITRLTKAL